MKIFEFSPRLLIANGRWRPEMSAFYSHVKTKNLVVFDAVKTKFFLSKSLTFIRKMGYAYVPFTIVDNNSAALQTRLWKISKLAKHNINILYKWPSGLLTNYFIALPSITNVLLRIGVRRGLKRRLSINFPKTLPGFFVTANFFQDTALREINLLALPSICLLSSILFFQEHFVTFPLFMNSKFSYMKNMYLFALITSYYEGFLSHLAGAKLIRKKLKKPKPRLRSVSARKRKIKKLAKKKHVKKKTLK